MSKKPDWLPEMVSTNGVWEEVLSRLYKIFDRDFNQLKPIFDKMQVWWDRCVLEGDQYEEGFWHLISYYEKETGERLLDPRRAERLPWCCPTLINAQDSAVRVWDYKEGRGRIRTYVWLESWDYVVILEKQKRRIGKIAFLITAFHVDGKSRLKNLERKYLNKEPEMQTPPPRTV
jgi:hypothetical protein